MPFDQFTIEQIAGDLLPGATDSQSIATGFHRNTMFNEEGGSILKLPYQSREGPRQHDDDCLDGHNDDVLRMP